MTTVDRRQEARPGTAADVATFPAVGYSRADTFCSAYFAEMARAASSIDRDR